MDKVEPLRVFPQCYGLPLSVILTYFIRIFHCETSKGLAIPHVITASVRSLWQHLWPLIWPNFPLQSLCKMDA